MSSAVKDWLFIFGFLLGLIVCCWGLYSWIDHIQDPVVDNPEPSSKQKILLGFLSGKERSELERCRNILFSDLERLHSLILRIESLEGVDKFSILELAKLCVKGERFAKLRKDFCLFCVVKYTNHDHWDKNGYLVTDVFAAKNDLDSLLRDPGEKDRSVQNYAFMIIITPKDKYFPELVEKEKILRRLLEKFFK